MQKKLHDLSDPYIEAAIDFQEGSPLLLCDKQVKGLQLRIGKHKHAWQFYHEKNDHGRRLYTCKPLGFYDRGKFGTIVAGHKDAHPLIVREPWHVNVAAARDKARVHAGKVIEGTAPPGKRAGVKFETALSDYIEYLKGKAPQAKRFKGGKWDGHSRWSRNVAKLGEHILLPRWSGFTLNELSERPDDVEDWHRLAVKQHGATSANHAARVLRALYKRRAKRDLSLSKVNLPTAAVEMHAERREQKGMASKDFPAWFVAWQAIESPVRRAYHMTNLLTGARPGELARTRWENWDKEADTLTIGDAKAGNDIAIPLTPAIRDALNTARKARPKAKPTDLIFPGCMQVGHREEMPARGHALRRTFKTVAQNECKVPDEVSAYLLGHVPEGMSQRYLLKWAMSSGKAIREAQARISRTMVELLHKKARKRAA